MTWLLLFSISIFLVSAVLLALVAWFSRRCKPEAERITAGLALIKTLRDEAQQLFNHALRERAAAEAARDAILRRSPTTGHWPPVTEEERFLLDLLRGYESVICGSELLFVPRGFPVERVMGVQKGLTQ